MTVSSLALKIFRMKYYDPNIFPIYRPNYNEDQFIRRGFYGGHADVYKPHGRKLYYYDVNSLYPYIMKTFSMPGGVPVWRNNLEKENLSSLYGFIEAYVVCPRTMNKPFLPYKTKEGTLLFPTGEFVGVYYSEEFIFAQSLGYKIIPLRGYIFQKKDSPFVNFVTTIYNKRVEAKSQGHQALVFGYKLIMNSLYGRFGINPLRDNTTICEKDEYEIMVQSKDFVGGEKISEKYFLVSNKINPANENWMPPTISAVQLAAATTACARIHMYKYTSRDDCYYTDTDSAILGNPLPIEEISSTEMGKLKLEYEDQLGYFLAPKTYMIKPEGKGDPTILQNDEEGVDDPIIKHKGVAKHLVTPKWFKNQYDNMYSILHDKEGQPEPELFKIERKFNRDSKSMTIFSKEINVTLRIDVRTKRFPVFDKNNKWIDTSPKFVRDYGGQEKQIIYLKDEINDSNMKQIEDDLKQEDNKSNSDSDTPLREESVISTQSNMIEEKLTLYKDKANKKRKSKKPQQKPNKRKGKKPP